MSGHTDRTTRQRMLGLLEGQEFSARNLAELLNIPVREIEDHLTHSVGTVRRHSGKQFLLIPSQCQDCGLVFGQRTRLTQPGRCPQCRSEFISPPRYRIREKALPVALHRSFSSHDKGAVKYFKYLVFLLTYA